MWRSLARKLLISVIVVLIATASIDVVVSVRAAPYIVSIGDISEKTVVIVPGAGAKGGVPSDVFKDRLLTATELYHEQVVQKILVSGDHGAVGYDEVNAGRTFLLERDVAPEDIFLDHAGFDTYDTMWRAVHIFDVKDAVIVTQAFHLPRAVYLARALGIDAVGVVADKQHYVGAERLWIREQFARVKAFFNVIFGPRSAIGGEAIPLNGDGRITWDEGV